MIDKLMKMQELAKAKDPKTPSTSPADVKPEPEATFKLSVKDIRRPISKDRTTFRPHTPEEKRQMAEVKGQSPKPKTDLSRVGESTEVTKPAHFPGADIGQVRENKKPITPYIRDPGIRKLLGEPPQSKSPTKLGPPVDSGQTARIRPTARAAQQEVTSRQEASEGKAPSQFAKFRTAKQVFQHLMDNFLSTDPSSPGHMMRTSGLAHENAAKETLDHFLTLGGYIPTGATRTAKERFPQAIDETRQQAKATTGYDILHPEIPKREAEQKKREQASQWKDPTTGQVSPDIHGERKQFGVKPQEMQTWSDELAPHEFQSYMNNIKGQVSKDPHLQLTWKNPLDLMGHYYDTYLNPQTATSEPPRLDKETADAYDKLHSEGKIIPSSVAQHFLEPNEQKLLQRLMKVPSRERSTSVRSLINGLNLKANLNTNKHPAGEHLHTLNRVIHEIAKKGSQVSEGDLTPMKELAMMTANELDPSKYGNDPTVSAIRDWATKIAEDPTKAVMDKRVVLNRPSTRGKGSDIMSGLHLGSTHPTLNVKAVDQVADDINSTNPNATSKQKADLAMKKLQQMNFFTENKLGDEDRKVFADTLLARFDSEEARQRAIERAAVPTAVGRGDIVYPLQEPAAPHQKRPESEASMSAPKEPNKKSLQKGDEDKTSKIPSRYPTRPYGVAVSGMLPQKDVLGSQRKKNVQRTQNLAAEANREAKRDAHVDSILNRQSEPVVGTERTDIENAIANLDNISNVQHLKNLVGANRGKGKPAVAIPTVKPLVSKPAYEEVAPQVPMKDPEAVGIEEGRKPWKPKDPSITPETAAAMAPKTGADRPIEHQYLKTGKVPSKEHYLAGIEEKWKELGYDFDEEDKAKFAKMVPGALKDYLDAATAAVKKERGRKQLQERAAQPLEPATDPERQLKQRSYQAGTEAMKRQEVAKKPEGPPLPEQHRLIRLIDKELENLRLKRGAERLQLPKG